MKSFLRRPSLFLLPLAVVIGCTTTVDDVVEISGDQATAIVIARFDEQLRLERDGESWMVVEPVNTPANPVTVENLLITIDQLRVEETISRSEDDFGQYGVDENAPRITIESADDRVVIVVGRSGQDFNTQFIRIDDGSAIHLARGRLNTTMRVDVWRERTIIDIDPASIRAATFIHPDGQENLRLEEGVWYLTDSDGEHEVAPERIRQWASFFNPLMTDRFAQVPRDIVTESGQRSIRFELDDGSVRQLYFLDIQGEYATVVDNSDTIYQVFGLRLNNFFPDLLGFY